MTEGTIINWLKKEGEEVVAGTPLFEMETDKLTITMDAEVSGTLLKILQPEGSVVPITEPIAIVGTPGEDISDWCPSQSPLPSSAPPARTSPTCRAEMLPQQRLPPLLLPQLCPQPLLSSSCPSRA